MVGSVLARVPARAALVALGVAAVLIGGWLFVRDSSLVRVRDVYIVGVSSSQERQIRAALRDAALDSSTLHLDEDRLRLAVERFPSVAEVRAEPDFPHKLTIEVVEREPVAAVELGGVRVPVGAGGLVMRGVRADKQLPTLRARRLSAESRIKDDRALASVSVLAAAPVTLRQRVERAWWGRRGLMLDMRSGPDLVFGSDRSAKTKWAAAARVLAEPSAAGAVYLDVRVPERVAAGGLQPVEAATESNPQPQPENAVTLDP
jgi:cell division protein FtsQ